MTDQLDTIVTVAGEPFALMDTDGDWSDFDPKAHGLPRAYVSTQCWDGFLCTYRVDDRLLLESVSVGWSRRYASGKGPPLWGHQARRCEYSATQWARYDVDRPIDFTGSLLVGRHPRRGSLIPVAFQYHHVTELLFTSGRLSARSDVTAEMERYRQTHADLPPLPDNPDPEARFAAARQRSRSYAHFFGCRRRERGE